MKTSELSLPLAFSHFKEQFPKLPSGVRLLTPETIPLENRLPIMQSVCNMIHAYNKKNPGAMYEPPPEDLLTLFNEGHTVLLSTDENKPEDSIVYFGAIKPKFNEKERNIYGMQLVEFGSSIVDPHMNGNGIGKLGNVLRMVSTYHQFGPDTLIYLTTVNHLNVLAVHSAGKMYMGEVFPELVDVAVPVPFHNVPYLAGLTCIFYENGHDLSYICTRRPQIEETALDLMDNLLKPPQTGCGLTIPCSIVVSDPVLALKFQRTCEKLDIELGQEPLISPFTHNIGKEDVLRANNLFTRIKSL